jgi:hypothetical protein
MRPFRLADSALVVLAVVLWSLAGPRVSAQPHDADDAPRTFKDPLPRADEIRWDVKVIEKGPFTVEKRQVENKQVRWLLKVDTDEGAGQINVYSLGTPGFYARFLDEDGVEITRVQLAASNTDGVRRGDKVRLTLTLPGKDVLKKTNKVVIVHYPTGP